jgi:hypothetical protein
MPCPGRGGQTLAEKEQAMTSVPRKLGVISAALLFGLPAIVAAQTKPNFSGAWKAAIAKSDFGPMPAPQSSVSKITHEDPKLKISTTLVSDSGEITFEMVFTTDGAENVNKMGPMEMRSKLRWEGAELIIESKATSDRGEFKANERWSLSEDRKTLKIVRTWSGPMGEATQTVIHDKQ